MRFQFLSLLFIFVIVAGIYLLGVNGPFLFDDGNNLSVLNRLQNGLVPWYSVLLTNPSSSLGRPFSMLTFIANYWFFGFNAFAFKVVNVVLHCVIGFMIFIFIKKILRNTYYSKASYLIAVATMIIWLLSPLFVSTVLYVVQRMAMLSTLFVLLALVCYLNYREGLERGELRWGQIAYFGFCSVCGFLSKENAALIPLFIVVLELFFCNSLKGSKYNRVSQYGAFLVGWLPVILGVAVIIIKRKTLLSYDNRDYTLPERLLTEGRILWSYIGSLIVPQASQFGLFHDDIELSRSLVRPLTTLLSLIAWSSVLIFVAIARHHEKLRPVAGGIAFFLAGHAMESSVFSLELYFEHRNYLPAIGIYLSLALVIAVLVKSNAISVRLAQFAFCLYIFVNALALSQRIMIWKTPETIIYSSYEAHPNSARAIVEAAGQDVQHGHLNEAVAKLERARKQDLAPQLGLGLQIVWGYCYLNQSGVEGRINELFGDVKIEGSPYTQTSLSVLFDEMTNKPCDKVPIPEVVGLLAIRLQNLYESDGYRKLNDTELRDLRGLQIKTLEMLNFLGRTDRAIQLAEVINRVGQGGFAVDLLSAIAYIDTKQMEKAKALIDKLSVDKSMFAQLEAAHLAAVKEMYMKQENTEGGSGGA